MQSQISLFQLATQYYASGRFAALSEILPVSANLLHHAVEMYLKGALAPVLDLKAMRKLGIPRALAVLNEANQNAIFDA